MGARPFTGNVSSAARAVVAASEVIAATGVAARVVDFAAGVVVDGEALGTVSVFPAESLLPQAASDAATVAATAAPRSVERTRWANGSGRHDFRWRGAGTIVPSAEQGSASRIDVGGSCRVMSDMGTNGNVYQNDQPAGGAVAE
ncbi:hypothetical protein KAREA_14830 [Prescottella equi]|nr:hypothetical protein KAREA_14830 [Prescottella equi]